MGQEAPYQSEKVSKRICIDNCSVDPSLTALGKARCILGCAIWTTN